MDASGLNLEEMAGEGFGQEKPDARPVMASCRRGGRLKLLLSVDEAAAYFLEALFFFAAPDFLAGAFLIAPFLAAFFVATSKPPRI